MAVTDAGLQAALAGDARAAARLMTQLENGGAEVPDLMAALYPKAQDAQAVGVTGPPGVGKSSLASELAGEWRRTGLQVGIVSVDPTSPITGGALLGDRVRMGKHTLDTGVFIRSMASRGLRGGLAPATHRLAILMAALGRDPVLIETVGAGQDESDVMGAAHTIVVVLAPGLGDGIQALKAGMLEIGDVFVVNKADRQGADEAAAYLRAMLAISDRTQGWMPPVLQTSAVTGAGVPELAGKIREHWEHLKASGELCERRRRIAEAQLEGALFDLLSRRAKVAMSLQREQIVDEVVAGRVDPYTAAAQVMADAQL